MRLTVDALIKGEARKFYQPFGRRRRIDIFHNGRTYLDLIALGNRKGLELIERLRITLLLVTIVLNNLLPSDFRVFIVPQFGLAKADVKVRAGLMGSVVRRLSQIRLIRLYG